MCCVWSGVPSYAQTCLNFSGDEFSLSGGIVTIISFFTVDFYITFYNYKPIATSNVHNERSIKFQVSQSVSPSIYYTQSQFTD